MKKLDERLVACARGAALLHVWWRVAASRSTPLWLDDRLSRGNKGAFDCTDRVSRGL